MPENVAHRAGGRCTCGNLKAVCRLCSGPAFSAKTVRRTSRQPKSVKIQPKTTKTQPKTTKTQPKTTKTQLKTTKTQPKTTKTQLKTTKIDIHPVEDTTPASKIYNSSGHRNRKCSAGCIGKFICHRLKLPEVLQRVIVLALLAGWLAITWTRVSLFLSEPTATRIYWEKEFPPPTISVCPRLKINMTMLWEYMMGNFHNHSLQEYIHLSGLPPADMIEGLNETSEYQNNRSTDVFAVPEGTWRAIQNYAYGGACATFLPEQSTKWFQLNLYKHHQFELADTDSIIGCYQLVLHGSPEFWGWTVPDMDTFLITNETTLTEVLVTFDREVRPNLRRAPCESDPSYSLSACQLRCFFDWLNCSMEESAESDSRPRCMSSEAFPYSFDMGLRVFVEFNGAGWRGERQPINRCPERCPEPCVTHRFGFQTRPSVIPSSADLLRLQVRFENVQRVMETYETFTLPELLAEMGGYLGLLLGWSLLSFFDAAHALVMRAWRSPLFNRRRR